MKLTLRKKLWIPIAANKLLLRKKSFLHQTGWIESFKEKKPIGNQGEVIPWMNYSIIEVLKNKITKEHTIFEFGSGYSTLFFASLSKEVTSIEHDREWADRISNSLPSNASIHYFKQDTDGEYCRAIHQFQKKHNIAVVDGRDRVNCLRQALQAIPEDGVIILDDSHRTRYKACFNLTSQEGYRSLTIEGIKPGHTGLFSTTIFYRDNNCLNI
jgi:hypothetical protein